jgi:antirestriction protein ArdC
MKGYTVFNAEQIDGLSDLYYAKPALPTPAIQRVGRVESFFAATGAIVRHGGDRAYCSVGTDHVQMPPIESFRNAGRITRRLSMRRPIMPTSGLCRVGL